MTFDLDAVNWAQVSMNGAVFFTLMTLGMWFIERQITKQFDRYAESAKLPAHEMMTIQLLHEREKDDLRDEADECRREVKAVLDDILSLLRECQARSYNIGGNVEERLVTLRHTLDETPDAHPEDKS